MASLCFPRRAFFVAHSNPCIRYSSLNSADGETTNEETYIFYANEDPRKPQAGKKSSLTLTDKQFKEVKKLIESYVKLAALGAIREISDKELERNARLLDAAGYSQPEIGIILHRAQSNISDILAGKVSKRKKSEK